MTTITTDITVHYTYSNAQQNGEKTVIYHDCTDSKAARDYAAKVVARALDTDTELLLNITTRSEGWLMTTIVSGGEAHSLYRSKDGIKHIKL